MNIVIAPSLLSADFSRLGAEVEALAKAGVPWLHLDVIDGNFAPNITFGWQLIKSLRRLSSLFFDTHLMIREPGRYLREFAAAGSNLAVIHIESCLHPQRVLCQIRELGMKAGVALNPDTDIFRCRWLLPYMDLLLVMGVNPGFSGQEFIPATSEKVGYCRQFLEREGYPDLPIEVDGGVNVQNAPALVEAGASILVSGSAFFKRANHLAALNDFALACGEMPENMAAVLTDWR